MKIKKAKNQIVGINRTKNLKKYYNFYLIIVYIINFITFNFQNDFDILVIESYYEETKFVMEKSEIKKKNMYDFCYQIFQSIKLKIQFFFYFSKNLSNNSLLIQVNKFTINKKT